MALTNIRLPNYATDVVGIYDENFSQLFNGASPMKALIKPSKKVMEHPVENGTTITDNVIINPVEIEMSMLLVDFRQLYAQIVSVYNKSTLVTIQTRVATFTQMLLTDMPHDEDPALFDVIAVALKFRKVEFVQAQFATLPASKVANKTNSSTINRGEQQGKEAGAVPTARSTVLLEAYKKVTGEQ